jgi:conjugative relaxase-like TrwC/TraI family protein
MAAVTRLAVGHDASYPFRQMGEPDVPAPVDYYLGAVEKGEPPGVWTGAGVTALGFEVGQQIDRAAFETLYGQFVNPQTGERLGRKPQDFERTPDVIYAELVAAEPEATARRRMELRRQAEHQARQPVHYWDATFNPSKSVTVAWLAARAAAITAERDGDAELAAEWREMADLVWAAVMKGNATMLARYQEKAGVTRAGRHGGQRTGTGDSAGRWEDARQWVIGSFRQHTSRDGDPHLHVHNLILHLVMRESDGRHRRLDGNALVRFRREANAFGAVDMEEEISRTTGLRWVPRKDGHGLEIAGISQEVMDLFSARRDTITARQKRLAEEYRQKYGRDPDARTLEQMRQQANFQTRKGKEGPLDLPEKLCEWEQQMHAAELETLTEVAYRMAAAGREIREREQAGAHGRDAVVAELAQQIAAQFAQERGQAVDEAEAASIRRFAAHITLGGAETGPFNTAALLRAWQAREQRDADKERDIRRGTARAEAQAQARVAEPAAAQAQRRVLPAYPTPRPELAPDQARRVMAEALAAMQSTRTAWTRADLVSYMQEKTPQGARANDAVLDRLADRVLTGGAGEYVALLSAPEWPRVPDGLRRANGDSVFRPPGAELYAAQAQITLEERLMSDAQWIGAPRLTPEHAAQLLGADIERLQAWLHAQTTREVFTGTTGCGLRPDQTAAT